MNAIEEPRRGAWTFLEAALAGLFIAWRCSSLLSHPLYLDIPLYLGLFWIFLALCPVPRAREALAVGLMLLFFAIYLKSVITNLLFVADLQPL